MVCALGRAIFFLDGVAGAAEEFAESAAALDHFPPAYRALVLRYFAQHRLALRIDRLGAVAFGVTGAGKEKSVLADAIDHRPLALGALVRRGASSRVLDLPECAGHGFVKRAVKVAQQLDPVEMLFFDLVELQFHSRRELHVHDFREGLDELVGHDRSEHRGMESAIDLHHVFAILDRLNDAGVRARPADPELLQRLHQARLGKARRGLREMLGRRNLDREDRLFLLQVGQELIFARDAGDAHEPVKNEFAAGGAEDGVAARRRRSEGHAGLVEFRGRHLARHKPIPDQLIQLGFVGSELVSRLRGSQVRVGGADRLVGFLRALVARRVMVRLFGQILIAELLLDERASHRQRLG